jgi:transcription elongation factor Elf1
MAQITKEQEAKYLAEGGGICPFCHSQDITGGSVEIEGRVAYQDVSCNICDESWTDEYTLTGITETR